MKEKERKYRKFMFEEGNFDDWLENQMKKISRNDNKCEISTFDQAKKELDRISENLNCLPQNYIKHFKQHLKNIRKYEFKYHLSLKIKTFEHISHLSILINKLKEEQNENNKCI